MEDFLNPTHEITIPSVHDSTPLKCRIYRPTSASDADGSRQVQKAIIIAHPYPPLGGSYDDPVVGAVAAQMRSNGHTVGTFNFRGVYGSRGSTSWTGRPECADYISFVGLLISYLTALGHESEVSSEGVDLILAGYSYGSMIASQLDSIEHALEQFLAPAAGSNQATIVSKGQQLVTSRDTPATSNMTCPTLRTRYLLIAPLLPPISSFLALRVSLPFFSKATEPLESHQDQLELKKHPTLALYGSQDVFASSRRLSAWAAKMHNLNTSFQGHQIDGAGHFWVEKGATEALLDKIAQWTTEAVA